MDVAMYPDYFQRPFWDRPLGGKGRAVGGACMGLAGWVVGFVVPWVLGWDDAPFNRIALGLLAGMVAGGILFGLMCDKPGKRMSSGQRK